MTTVLGWYGHGNIGDEAYKIVFPKMLPHQKLHFADRLSDCSEDAVILGGGDILYTDFVRKLSLSTDKYALSVSVRGSIPDIGFKEVISRDKTDLCRWLPDFTFILRPNPENGLRLIRDMFARSKSDLYGRVCAVVVNANLMTRESTLARDSITFEKFAFELARLIDSTPASFIFLPFGYGFPHNDCITNSVVYSRCKFWKKNALVLDRLEPQQALDVISACDMTISSRLHSSIFSCIGGVPFIDITHHDKNRHFLRTIDKERWSVDYWHFCYDKCQELATSFLSSSSYKNEVYDISNEYRRLLEDAIPILPTLQ